MPSSSIDSDRAECRHEKCRHLSSKCRRITVISFLSVDVIFKNKPIYDAKFFQNLKLLQKNLFYSEMKSCCKKQTRNIFSFQESFPISSFPKLLINPHIITHCQPKKVYHSLSLSHTNVLILSISIANYRLLHR